MRLRHPREFRRVWNEGRSWAHPLFILWGAPNGETASRVGITASRKVGNAVERNRARRLLREAARRVYPHLMPGWDLVLVVRRSAVEANEPQVRSAFESLLRRAELWLECA